MRRLAAAVTALVLVAGAATALAVTTDTNASLFTTLEASSMWKTYSKQNPNESARVKTYWLSGGAKPAVTTQFGRFLVEVNEDRVTTDPPPPPPPPPAACADGADNDGDGKVDLADPGCSSAGDEDETDVVQPPATTITGSQCTTRASVSGAVIENVTVTGGCEVRATNVTIRNANISSDVKFTPGASGGKLLNSTAKGFYLFGADNVTIEGNMLDARASDNINLIWDEPAGDRPQNFTIRNNTIRNVYDSDPSSHNEGIYVGYSGPGLIEGNRFENNGNTAHLFFTNFGNQFNGSSYPRNICVRGNTFGATHGAFFDINFHPNVGDLGPGTTGIRVDPDNVMPHGMTHAAFRLDC